MLVEGVHPLLQLLPALRGEEDRLRAPRGGVDEGQAVGPPAHRVLLRHVDARALCQRQRSTTLSLLLLLERPLRTRLNALLRFYYFIS